jgi:phosphoglycerate kinase
MIEKLLPKCSNILIGGAMGYAFLTARGINIGEPTETDVAIARRLMNEAERLGARIILPQDVMLTGDSSCDVQDTPSGSTGKDIGEKTYGKFFDVIRYSRHVLWNGPVGVFEEPPFDIGSRAVAYAMALNQEGFTVVGGGDTAAAVSEFGVSRLVKHVSTGGGAALALVENGTLPGLEAIANSPSF